MAAFNRFCQFALLFYGLSVPVLAQQPAEEEKKPVAELFEVVVVTAEMERPESATTIAEVTAEQIQHRNVTNIGEAFELLPGVQFRIS